MPRNRVVAAATSITRYLFIIIPFHRTLCWNFLQNENPVPSIIREEINKCFHETYEKQYGHSTPDGPIEFINLRLVATGHIPKTSEFVKKFHQSAEVNENNRSVFFDNNKYDTEVLNRANIKSDKSVEGPVIIEEETATTVVPPKYYLKKDNFGNLIITKKQ